MAVLCALAWADVRCNGWAVTVVIGAHVLIAGSLLFMLALRRHLERRGIVRGPARRSSCRARS